MKLHWLKLRATAHPTEDLDKVGQAMRLLSGLDEDGFAAATEVVPIESSHGGIVHHIETTLSRAREVRAAMAQLVPDPGRYAAEIEARTDEDGVFYMRFGKQDAVQGRITPLQSEDAIQVRCKVEVHPAKRELAVAALQDWADGGL